MQITIDLEPETEAAVRAQAAARGVEIEEYVRSLMKQWSVAAPGEAAPERVSLEEFERDWDLFSEGTEGLPVLSDEDLSREAMYSDHD